MLFKTISYLERVFQQNFLPFVEEEFGPIVLEKHKKVLWALEIVQIERLIPTKVMFSRGRPRKDHSKIARAFVAKHVLNLSTTDMLIHMLKVDKYLRYICGWEPYERLPSEATFSRVFSLMAKLNIPETIHESLVTTLFKNEIVPHAVTDSMPIPSKEKPAKKVPTAKRLRGKETVCHRQAHNNLTVSEMLKLVPTDCSTGRKIKANGNNHCWDGYKLHCTIAEGKFILAAAISSASTCDNLMAIPLIKMTSLRTRVLYDLMDTAYDAADIRSYISNQGRVPIIKEHKRQGKRNEIITRERKARKVLGWQPADAVRLRLRSLGERVFARLSAGFSTLSIFVRGFKKVKSHIFLSILAHTSDELYRNTS